MFNSIAGVNALLGVKINSFKVVCVAMGWSVLLRGVVYCGGGGGGGGEGGYRN